MNNPFPSNLCRSDRNRCEFISFPSLSACNECSRENLIRRSEYSEGTVNSPSRGGSWIVSLLQPLPKDFARGWRINYVHTIFGEQRWREIIIMFSTRCVLLLNVLRCAAAQNGVLKAVPEIRRKRITAVSWIFAERQRTRPFTGGVFQLCLIWNSARSLMITQTYP